MSTVYIVDDDPTAITLLKSLLSEHPITVVGATGDLKSARKEIMQLRPDMLFLDVEMPEMSGLDFCTQLTQQSPQFTRQTKVVFYTGYDHYVLEALRRQAFDYILKPATSTQLSQLMNRYYENRLNEQSNDKLSPATHRLLNSPTPPPIIMLADNTSEHKPVHAHQIAFFRFSTERRLWEVVTLDGQAHALRHRTNADIILGYTSDFVQIHKRYIVNIQHIERITETCVYLNPPLDALDELHVSRSYRHNLLNTFYSM